MQRARKIRVRCFKSGEYVIIKEGAVLSGPVIHTLFGREILRDINPYLKALLLRNDSAYYWGQEGPDPLQYASFYDNSHTLTPMGGLLHLLATDRVFACFGRYLADLRGQPEYETMLAYCMGFIGHYAMDQAQHTYVFPRAREISETWPEFREKGEGAAHQMIEVGTEWMLYQCKRLPGETPERILHPIMEVHPMLARGFAALHTKTAEEIFGISLHHAPFTSCFLGTYWLLKTHYRLVDQVPMEDPLNLCHRPFQAYDDPEKIHHETLLELYDLGKAEAIRLMEQLFCCLEDGTIFEPALSKNCKGWNLEGLEEKIMQNSELCKFYHLKSNHDQ